jgi:hypothetical protein
MLGIALAGSVYTMVAFEALSLSAAALQVGTAVLLKVANAGWQHEQESGRSHI